MFLKKIISWWRLRQRWHVSFAVKLENDFYWYADTIVKTDFNGDSFLQDCKKKLVPAIKEVFDFKGDERDIVIISFNKLPRSF